MHRRKIGFGLLAAYLVAGFMAWRFAPAAMTEHLLFYVFFITFAAVCLLGPMLFDLHALTRRAQDEEGRHVVARFASSAAGVWFAELLVAGTVLLAAAALIGAAG